MTLPATALAQDAATDVAWPSADELRRDLQAIGYEFAFDGSGRQQMPEFDPALPALWTLVEPSVEGDVLPDGSGLDPFTLQLIDNGSGAVQVLYAGASADDGAGELDLIATTLMEVEARLPEGSGLDEAVWFLGNKWQEAGTPSAAPCAYRETDESLMLAWFGGDGAEISSFFGTVGTTIALPDELELCKQALAEAADAGAPTTAAPDETAPGETTTEPAVDYSVTPDEAVDIIEADTHTIIDVRTVEEYDQAHVKDAVNIHVEEASFIDRIAELDPDEPYLLYCRSGRRSDLAAQQMAAAGFTDLADAGGLADLARAGAPIE